MKDRLFYGMRVDLKGSLRYLFDRPETTYANLLAAAHVAEVEYEKKTVTLRSKGIIEVPSVDITPGSPILATMEDKIDKLTSIVKAVPYKKGKNVTVQNNQVQESSQTQAADQSKGPKPRKKVFEGQCWKCGGWGHPMRECPSQGNGEWGEASRMSNPPKSKPQPPAQR